MVTLGSAILSFPAFIYITVPENGILKSGAVSKAIGYILATEKVKHIYACIFSWRFIIWAVFDGAKKCSGAASMAYLA